MKWFGVLVLAFWSFFLHGETWKEALQQSTVCITEGGNETTLKLTLPDGEEIQFDLETSELMHPDLASSFPQIRAWKGRSTGKPDWSVRCEWSPHGLHLQLFTPHGSVYLDRLPDGAAAAKPARAPGQNDKPFHCVSEMLSPGRRPAEYDIPPSSSFHQIRTFRLAVAAAGEFTEYHGGTVESALAAVVTVFNRVGGIYERELGVQLVLVPGIEHLLFTNRCTDPFSYNGPSVQTVYEAQLVFDSLIGSPNYDLGILLNTGAYGGAYLGSVCDPSRKGSACIGLPEPEGEAFALYAAHEMAHQLGANHTFNSGQGTCSANRYADTAVEPGTGSTLMSYAGLPCGDDELQPLMNDYFHAENLREIRQHLLGIECGQITTTSNQLPVVSAPGHIYIPRQTPFQLRAEAHDPDGDSLAYCWEQMDIGPVASLSDPDVGFGPLFRSFPPAGNPVRTFPRYESLLENVFLPGERLPQVPRTMRFRVTVRDSNNHGATAHADTLVEVVSAGPFRLTSHNDGYFKPGQQVVTWDVAGTTNAPLNLHAVNLLLSTNGGKGFQFLLASNAPNDGVQTVMFPDVNSSRVRLKLEAVDQVFFDVTDCDILVSESPQFNHCSVEGTSLLLKWKASPVAEYRIEATQDLSADSWTELSVTIENNGLQMEAVVPISDEWRFFRLKEMD